MVFVIDQTGSTVGLGPSPRPNETMRHCIANMNPGEYLPVDRLQHGHLPFASRSPVPNTPDNVAKALTFLEAARGQRRHGHPEIGGICAPISPTIPTAAYRLLHDRLGTSATTCRSSTTSRSTAAGRACSRLVSATPSTASSSEGMAREGRGAPEYLAVNTNAGAQYGGPMPASGVKGAKDAADRFYHRIASPLLLDVHVDWNGLPVEDVYPKQIPRRLHIRSNRFEGPLFARRRGRC